MNDKEVLNHIKELLFDLLQSPRWDNPDQPSYKFIRSIGERINSIETMQAFRKNEDYLLLLELSSAFEQSLNDDWMPYQILGLELAFARQLLGEILKKYDEVPQGQWATTIKELYDKIKK